MSPLTQKEVVDTQYCKLPVSMDSALRSLTYLLFIGLHFLIHNYKLYPEDVECDELANYAVYDDALLPILFSLPGSVATVLEIMPPRPAGPGIVELDEHDVPGPAPQPPVPPLTLAFSKLARFHYGAALY